MNWAEVASLVLGGGLVAAAVTSGIGLWSDHIQREANKAAERRQELREKREAKRARLAPLYAAAVRSAGEIAEADARKNYRLQGDDETKLAERLNEMRKVAQARLDEVGVPLELEAGTEEFNERYDKFRKRYIRKVTAIVQPFAGLTQVDIQNLKIDLFEDLSELKAIAKKHLQSLDEPLL